MIGDSQNPLMATVIGLAVLVMGGIGVGTVVDLRLNHSEENFGLKEDIEQNAVTLADLREHRRLVEQRWQETHVPALDHDDRLASMEAKLRTLDRKIESIEQTRATHDDAISMLEADFLGYRGKHRNSVRNGLVGQTLDALVLRDGKRYAKVTLKSFGTDWMEIRHEHGGARVAFRDLDDAWRARIMWNPDDEVVATPAAPQPVPAPIDTPAAPSNSPEADDDVPPADRDQEIQSARRNFQVSKLMLRQATEALDEARRGAAGNRRSPSNSLETWEERIAKLQRVETARSAAHEQARAELMRVAPNDPLLYQP